MRLTTKGRYAVTAMLDLAFHQGNGPITLADIAHRQGISLSYLEQLFSKLRKQALVKSVRGPGGGYVLGMDTDEINVSSVITAVDERLDTTRCKGSHNCQENERCLTHDLWHDLSDQIYDYLTHITLSDLMERRGVRQVAQRQDDLQERKQQAEANEKASVSFDSKVSSSRIGA